MVEFKDDVELDTSQVEDRRGMGAAGRGGVAVGGLGIVGVIIMLLLNVLGGGGGNLPNLNDLNGTQVGGGAPPSDIAKECKTGADANTKEECRILGFTNSIQAYWKSAFAAQNEKYTPARTVYFQGAVDTGCGTASSAVGPFYCPPDQRVYIDLGFFNELQSKFGAQGGPFAEAYVIAHEYGHHIQNLSGILDRVARDRSTGPNSASVRSELQADCLAGVWANHAVETGFITNLTQDDINRALNAASSVGDDYIQGRMQGQVTPETWTHGSSEARQRWFTTGLDKGNANACDTFSVAKVE